MDSCIHLQNYRHKQDIEHFHLLWKILPALLQSNFCPCRQATTALLCIELIFPPSGYSIGTQHYFFKIISYCNPWQLCQKLINHLYLDLFLDSLLSYWFTCLSNTTLSWYCCFVVRFEIRLYKSPSFVVLFKNCFRSYDLGTD